MTARPLPADTPAAQGVDATGIEAFLDAVEAAPGIEPHSLMILRHGKLIAAGWWAPYTAGRKQLLYSLSKSFTATAAGLAVAEGLLDLDAPVVSYFPEFEAGITDPRSRAMLVRHIASMASGTSRTPSSVPWHATPTSPSAVSCCCPRTAPPAPSSRTTSPLRTPSPRSSSVSPAPP